MSDDNTAANDAQPKTIKVSDRGEMIDVPTTLEYNDLSAHYGSVPDQIRVDRIFRYDGIVRVEMRDGENELVEAGYFREDDHRPGTDTGWVAERIDNAAPSADLSEGPGETLWTRN